MASLSYSHNISSIYEGLSQLRIIFLQWINLWIDLLMNQIIHQFINSLNIELVYLWPACGTFVFPTAYNDVMSWQKAHEDKRSHRRAGTMWASHKDNWVQHGSIDECFFWISWHESHGFRVASVLTLTTGWHQWCTLFNLPLQYEISHT